MERTDVQTPTAEDWRMVSRQLPQAMREVAICVGGEELVDALQMRPSSEVLDIGAIELIDSYYPGTACDVLRRAKDIKIKQDIYEAHSARITRARRFAWGLIEEASMFKVLRPMRRK